MNHEVYIYPSKQFPIATTWGEIRDEYKRLIKKLDIDQKEYGIFESLYHKNVARQCIANFDSLPILSPQGIVVDIKHEIPGNEWYADYVDLRYHYIRNLEFYDSGHLIYWYFYFGSEDANIDCLYESQIRPLSKADEEKFGKSMDELQFYFKMETRFQKDMIDPIFILAIIFCKLVDGVILLDYIPKNFFLEHGYYTSEELADLIGLDMGKS